MIKQKTLKLITESDNFEYEVIKEAEQPNKPETITVRGIYAQANIVNGNGRTYKYDILCPAINKFIEEKVNTNTALEELEHPDHIEISPDRVCARTLSLVEDNKNWIGTSVVLASDTKFGIKGTPCGDLLKSLIQFDCAVGHSTRGVGNVDEETGQVQDYQLICIDTVLQPSIGIFNKSNANRFVNGILESKNFIINTHGEILEAKFNALEKSLAKMPNTFDSKKRAAHVGKALTDFFNSIVE